MTDFKYYFVRKYNGENNNKNGLLYICTERESTGQKINTTILLTNEVYDDYEHQILYDMRIENNLLYVEFYFMDSTRYGILFKNIKGVLKKLKVYF